MRRKGDAMTANILPRLGFLGGGKMATALVHGLLAAKLTTPDRIIASDVISDARSALEKSAGIRTTSENRAVVADSDAVVLAVKPQVLAAVLAEIKPLLTSKHLVVSIAAGFTLKQLSEGLGSERRIIRVMPNTPCLVGASASAYSLGSVATADDAALVERILNAVGRSFRLPEHLLDAVTGLSASGPAYVAVIVESLADGGVRMGLPRDVAMVLAAQTVFGAAKMVLEAGLHPALLKDMVASAGGTTIAGLHALERGGARAALMDAVEAATKRATELGRG
jgi:pyrroline-5-carboxylate reductase